MSHDIVDRYVKLFRGRGDAIGTWAGGSQREQVDIETFRQHLTSDNASDWIGVYPHLGNAMDQHCSWGCVDIDGKDFDHDWAAMMLLAEKLVAVLQVKSVFAHIERTRNGYHLWVFPTVGHVLAATMRRALMAACKAVSYDPKEVNPKSEELLPGKLGNYVRLPYYGALSGGPTAPDRIFIDPNGMEATLEDFLDNVQRTETADLQAVAALWTPPARVTFDGPPPEDVALILPILDGMAYTIWKDGPLEGRDRSNTLAKLAYRLHDTAIAMPVAFAVVRDADVRWGKFSDRPDCDAQIMSIVERAYSS
jgi:hypothetical protein